MISVKDITDWQLQGKRDPTNAHQDYDYLFSKLLPEVNYWFSAKEYCSQKAWTVVVREPGAWRQRADNEKTKVIRGDQWGEGGKVLLKEINQEKKLQGWEDFRLSSLRLKVGFIFA